MAVDILHIYTHTCFQWVQERGYTVILNMVQLLSELHDIIYNHPYICSSGKQRGDTPEWHCHTGQCQQQTKEQSYDEWTHMAMYIYISTHITQLSTNVNITIGNDRYIVPWTDRKLSKLVKGAERERNRQGEREHHQHIQTYKQFNIYQLTMRSGFWTVKDISVICHNPGWVCHIVLEVINWRTKNLHLENALLVEQERLRIYMNLVHFPSKAIVWNTPGCPLTLPTS